MLLQITTIWSMWLRAVLAPINCFTLCFLRRMISLCSMGDLSVQMVWCANCDDIYIQAANVLSANVKNLIGMIVSSINLTPRPWFSLNPSQTDHILQPEQWALGRVLKIKGLQIPQKDIHFFGYLETLGNVWCVYVWAECISLSGQKIS